LLTNFGDTLRAERIRGARPAERRLCLFVGLEQRLVRPLGLGRRIGVDAIHAIENRPDALGANGDCLFYIFNRLVHCVLSSYWLVVSFMAHALAHAPAL